MDVLLCRIADKCLILMNDLGIQPVKLFQCFLLSLLQFQFFYRDCLLFRIHHTIGNHFI